MSTHTEEVLPQITRRELPSGKFRYEVDGEVHTAKSGRLYTHASVYTAPEYVRKTGNRDGTILETVVPAHQMVFLHARADLAAKGSPDAKRCGFVRTPGVVEIEAV